MAARGGEEEQQAALLLVLLHLSPKDTALKLEQKILRGNILGHRASLTLATRGGPARYFDV